MVSGRRGHSLVELIVAMAFLAATLSAIAATGVVALRRTGRAILTQDVAAAAALVLDSLISEPAPASGSAAGPGRRLEWVVDPPAGGWSRVLVRGIDEATGSVLLELVGAWAPPPVSPHAPSPAAVP